MLLLLLLPHAIEFNRDVRPILSEYCFTCHGPDTAKRKAGLRLDTAEGGKTVLVPGKPADSELFSRLMTHEPNKSMPPASLGKKPTPAQVALIKRWIEEGAVYQAQWSFIAPNRPTVPKVSDTGWGRNAIDGFLLARLEAEGLKPSREADRRTLLRRLSFDLLGLPPTPEAVDAFVNDKGEKAYERAVDQLLASRHFGERMALYWLDLVRYGDTGGYHSDNHRDISLYRDWVIDAFNNNKRFDQFTIEQLAGDLLPAASSEQRIASGYNRMLMTTEEGGAQAKEYLAKYAADRVRNASTVWLGLTMGCAECHSHKYDPVTIREFYQFAAFWADISEVPVGRQPQTKIPTTEHQLTLARIDQELTEARRKLETPTPALEAAQKKWETAIVEDIERAKPAWRVVVPNKSESLGGQTLTTQSDGSILASGKTPLKDTLTFTLPTDGKPVSGLRLLALVDSSLGGTLTRGNGNFVLTKITISAPNPVKIVRAVADYSQAGFPVDSLLKKGQGWGVEGHLRKENRQAVFAFEKPVVAPSITVRLEFNSAYDQHIIGRVQLAFTDVPNPSLGDKAGVPDAVVKALATPESKRDMAQKSAITAHFRSVAPELAATRAEIATLTTRRQQMETNAPQTLVSMSVAPRTMRVLMRGNWLDDSGEIVQPGVPASLPALNVKGRATRLDLARWLTSKDNPLAARVFVNRAWRLVFGQGLVTTLDDFGAQGTHPSHPELLDWLAVEFRESGWDVKHLIRLMVTSSAYRQTSVSDAALRGKDPANKLIARQSRFRLDAELVRDNALAVSGLLVDRVGGPSVKPYQPAGYWAYLNFPTRDWIADKGDNQYRRGIYTYWQRTFPHPSLLAFDAPSREECTVERPRSNTPQQALVLLNDPTYVEAARVLATKAYSAAKDDAGRLNWVYRRVLGRSPREMELRVLLGLLAKHREQYARDEAETKALLSVGDNPPDVSQAVAVAAWTSVTRAMLNLHETINRE